MHLSDWDVCLVDLCPAQSKQLKNEKASTLLKDVARAAAPATSKHVKKASKAAKKKGGWWSALGGVMSFAADLVPAVLPFLLANHGPTKAKVAALPSSQQPVAAGAPLAQSNPLLGNMCGMKDIRATRDGKGNISKLRVRTFDFLTSLPTAAYGAGDLIAEWYLSPMDPMYEGTKFAMYASQYEKYTVRKVALIYEPTTPATTTGAIAACVFADPTVDAANLGVGDGLRVVSSQLGADTFQIWGAGLVEGPSTKALYTEPNGGDLRFTAAGKVALVAATAIVGGIAPGNIYQMTDIEFSVPSLTDNIESAAGLRFEDTTETGAPVANKPLQNLDTEIILLGGSQINFSTSQVWTQSGTAKTGNVLSGLPAGDYFVGLRIDGTAITASGAPVVTDEATSAGVETITSLDFMQANRAFTYKFISVPPNVAATVPMLGFTNVTGTTCTGGKLWVFKINEGFYANDADPMLPSIRRYRESDTCRIIPYYINKRQTNYFAGTAEGERATQTRKLAALAARLDALDAQSRDQLVVQACTVAPDYGYLGSTHRSGSGRNTAY